MKKVFIPLFLFSAMLIGTANRSVDAIPAFKNEFEAVYAEQLPEELLAEARCNSCHVPGEPKRVNNEYGNALAEFLHKDDFPRERLEAEPDVVAAEIRAALQQVAEQEASTGGTFGERIESGQLPVELPPEEDE